jgi:hypothetical protein
MQVAELSPSNNTPNMRNLISILLQMNNISEGEIDISSFYTNLQELYTNYINYITPNELSDTPNAFLIYIIYYVMHHGVDGIFNENLGFHDIKEICNITHANYIKNKMIERNINVECRCGVGHPHSSQITDTYIRCEMGTYVKIVYDAVINNFKFIKQNTTFTRGQCYARRILMDYGNDGWYYIDEDDLLHHWKDICNYPTLAYDIDSPEVHENTRFRVASLSHKMLLRNQFLRQLNHFIPFENYNEDPSCDPEDNATILNVIIDDDPSSNDESV